jgi:4,5-DOPA dioxygenase extradiol
MNSPTRMPAVFLGHGSPMNALEVNRYSEAWRALGQSIPRPRAVLAISAHWYITASAVLAMERPRTIHDFYGFPKALFDVEYPSPGDPELAAAVSDLAAPVWVGLDHDSWGIDHGTWSVLVHVFPQADVPVIQLSIDASKPPAYHLDLGRRLGALRDQGVLILGSGNIVHNLALASFRHPEGAFDWATRFDEDVKRYLRDGDDQALLDYERHPDGRLSVPTPDHYLPMLYVAGLRRSDDTLNVLVDGVTFGCLAMTAFRIG